MNSQTTSHPTASGRSHDAAGRDVARFRAEIASIGPHHDATVTSRMMELYGPELDLAGDGLGIVEDVPYGPDERQRLDLYGTGRPGAPVLLYVPGGGFIGGDRRATEAFYRNIGIHFARHGCLTIIPSYRLAPRHPWPAGSEDTARALAWAGRRAAGYGGDADRIVLFGQSAGATHAAGFLFDPDLQADAPPIRRALLLSGFYRMAAGMEAANPNLSAYFGTDESVFEARSAISRIAGCRTPLWLGVAEFDPELLATSTLELATALCRFQKRCPPLTWIEGHNHTSTVFSIGSADDGPAALFRRLVDEA